MDSVFGEIFEFLNLFEIDSITDVEADQTEFTIHDYSVTITTTSEGYDINVSLTIPSFGINDWHFNETEQVADGLYFKTQEEVIVSLKQLILGEDE